MMLRWSRLRFLCCIAALGGCNFEGSQQDSSSEMNMCMVASDCDQGSDCVEGMCQAQEADTPLTIALQVTPLHMPNGQAPLPILLKAFRVKEPMKLPFSLPSAITVGAKVRSGETPIDGDVTFTPTTKIAGIPPATVTASVTSSTANDQDYSVRLLKGVEYRMVVRPMDMSSPPFAKTFVAGETDDLNVDFAAIETTDQTFAISGAPSDRDLTVTAFDVATGEAVSSTGMVSGGKVMMKFVPDALQKPYRLEIRASNTYDDKNVAMMPAQALCDTDTPAFPVFSIASNDLGKDAKIALPPQPQRIRYEGTVELCPDEAASADSVTDLPITLHAQMLLFEKMPTGLAASFDTTTSASYDKATKSLHFCVEVMPGEYDVLATPPVSMRCALFAERKTIKAPNDQTDVAGGALLSLPEAAYLGGKLQTMGSSPLSGASVDAIALGRSNAVELKPGDVSVTRYNRSSQTTTNEDGSFKLPVDLGSYDIVIKPPVDSGFPWQINPDIEIGTGVRKMPLMKTIDMPSPVVVTGLLHYPGANEQTQATLDGAEIDAYALIDDGTKDVDGMSGMRAVAIGKAIADEEGQFMLLLPPSTRESW